MVHKYAAGLDETESPRFRAGLSARLVLTLPFPAVPILVISAPRSGRRRRLPPGWSLSARFNPAAAAATGRARRWTRPARVGVRRLLRRGPTLSPGVFARALSPIGFPADLAILPAFLSGRETVSAHVPIPPLARSPLSAPATRCTGAAVAALT